MVHRTPLTIDTLHPILRLLHSTREEHQRQMSSHQPDKFTEEGFDNRDDSMTEGLTFLGVPIADKEIACGVADGLLDPHTKVQMEMLGCFTDYYLVKINAIDN